MNVQNQKSSDELTLLIIQQLGERQHRVEQMQCWERKYSHNKYVSYFSYYGLAIAVCVIAFIVIPPFDNSGKTTLDELGITYSGTIFRAAASSDIAEISNMIRQENYCNALLLTQELLQQSDAGIEKYKRIVDQYNEEELYELQENLLINSELRWIYIYILVCMNETYEAINEIKTYLSQEDFCEHRSDAEVLLKKLEE